MIISKNDVPIQVDPVFRKKLADLLFDTICLYYTLIFSQLIDMSNYKNDVVENIESQDSCYHLEAVLHPWVTSSLSRWEAKQTKMKTLIFNLF